MQARGLRHEWLTIGYFVYTTLLAAVRIPGDAWRAGLVLVVVCALIVWLSRFGLARDLAPVLYALIAFRQMDWFAPAVQDGHLERVWIVWDRALLDEYGLRTAIESLGRIGPGLLEVCYLLVYGVAPVAVWILIQQGGRSRVGVLWVAYLAGTLGAYALFPYFPSDPPRVVFPGADLPPIATLARRINLAIVGNYGIHTSVFPSAHVSSVFSAAWGLLAALPRQKGWGAGMAVYGVMVSVATVYGRYHYSADVAAGVAVSLVAGAGLWVMIGYR